MKRIKLCSEINSIFCECEDRDMLIEGIQIEKTLQRILKQRASSATDFYVREAEPIKLTLVCYSSIVHGLPIAGATETAKTIQLNFQLHNSDKETIPFTDVIKKISISIPNKTLLWEHQKGTRGCYVILSHKFPIGKSPPSSVNICVDAHGKIPQYKLNLKNNELRSVLHQLYNLGAASPIKTIGSTKDDIISVFLLYCEDNKLIDKSTGLVKSDRFLENEFDCKVSGVSSLIREILLKKLSSIDSFMFVVSIPGSSEHQLPGDVFVGNENTDWLAKYNAAQQSINLLSLELESVVDSAKDIFRRSTMNESFNKSPHDSISSWVTQQSSILKELTKKDRCDSIRKAEAATDNTLWEDISLCNEALIRIERSEQASIVSNLIAKLPNG